LSRKSSYGRDQAPRPGRGFDLLRPEPGPLDRHDHGRLEARRPQRPDHRPGKTKTEVKDKLRAKHTELAAGIRTTANYTVEQCLNDWLETLNTQAQSTLTGYRITVRHLIELIGTVKLAELKVRDVDFALDKLAERLSTRSVRLARMILIQAIRNAMVNDLVVRNTADLATVPTVRPGRPSKSLDLDHALAVLDPARGLLPYWAQPEESACGHTLP
jgi:hypothetical protein